MNAVMETNILFLIPFLINLIVNCIFPFESNSESKIKLF